MKRLVSALLYLLWLHLALLNPAWAQTLEVPIFEGGEGLSFFFDCAKDYQSRHPGIHVDLYGDPRISEKLRIRLLEGSYPEVTNANLNYWKLLGQGHLEDLSGALEGPALGQDKLSWRDSFLPGSLERFSVEGKTYAVPLIYTVHSCWYNRALFRQKGWTPPRTWDEFFALSRQIKATGLAPVAFQGRYSYYAQPLIDNTFYQLAGRPAFYAMKRLESGSFNNPAMVETLGLIQRAASETFQDGALGMSHTEAQLSFFQGRAAMIFCGSWLKSEMMGNIPADFEPGQFPLPLPGGPHVDDRALLAGAGYYFVFHDSPHPELGVDFLRYLTSLEVASRFARERDIVVAVKGANVFLSTDLQDLANIVESSTSTFGDPPGAGYPEMSQVWADARTDLLRGNKKPEEIALFLEDSARAIKERARGGERSYPYWGRTLALLLFFLISLTLRRPPQVSSDSSTRPSPGWKALVQFLGLPLGLYAGFLLFPSLLALLASFTEWDGTSAPRFTGIDNLSYLLCQSDQLWRALSNNLFLMLAVPLLVLPLSLFLAFALSQRLRGWSLYRGIFFFPNLLGVAGILLWQQLYNPNGGPINALLSRLGLTAFEHFPWLSQDHLYWALLPMAMWGSSGFYMVLLLAAMENVPKDLYESAEIDGANDWQKFVSITLPHIGPTLGVSLLFLMVGGLKAFETVWLLTNQEPTSGNHLIGTLLVQATFERFELGGATAIALILLLLAWSVSNLMHWLSPQEQN